MTNDRPDAGTLDVLLVEDNPGDVRLFEEYLSEADLLGAELERASTLESALDRLRNRSAPPDVVLLDLGLPDAGGLEAVKTIVEAVPDLPVVVLTGRDDRRTAVEALREGAEDYLLKGEVGPDVLARSIRYAVERKRADRELEAERARLREVFENAPTWMTILRGPEHVFEMVNPAYRDFVGEREVVGSPVREVFPELEGEGFFELLDHVYETGETVRVEERRRPLATGDGVEHRYITFVFMPRREGGEVVGVIGHGVDVTEQVERRRQAERAEERWASVVELAPTGIIISDVETGEYRSVNETAAAILGYAPEELEGRSALAVEAGVGPERRAQLIEEVRNQGGLRNEPIRLRRRDGEVRHVRWSARLLERSGREYLFQTIQDVTDQREAKQVRRLLATAVETMATGVLITGPELEPPGPEIRYVNEAMTEITGYGREELVGETPRLFQGPDTEREELDRLKRRLSRGEPFEGETINYRKDGTPYHLRWQVTPLQDGSGEISHFVSVQEDVTDQKRAEEQLRHQALHDPLTGLANRTLLTDRVEQGLARVSRRDLNLGLIILDIVRFKRINDRLGHAAGDRVLEAFARRLEEATREEDTVARWGGDEFVVVLPDLDTAEDLATCWERIETVLEPPFEMNGESVPIDVRAGAVLSGGSDDRGAVQSQDPEEVLRSGDLALREAKERAAGTLHLFEPGEQGEGLAHLRRERQLRRGIENEEFVAHYQPVVRLEDGEAVGVEALARWEHPGEGLLSPGAFLPLAEELRLISQLGNDVVRKAFREVAGWGGDSLDGRPFTLSINLSGQQLENPELPELLASWLEEAGLPPRRVHLEVTETSVMRSPGIVESLRDLGTEIYLDDFGTGYSTFSYLRDLTLDGLKIDRSFVTNLGRSPEDEALVDTMITLADRLDLTLVAEGVETEPQRDRLMEMECRLGQGYFFARPMPANEVSGYVAAPSSDPSS